MAKTSQRTGAPHSFHDIPLLYGAVPANRSLKPTEPPEDENSTKGAD